MTDPILSGVTASSIKAPEIVCITGVEPEVHAYAMAKYSRSSLSMKTSLEEISSQRAEEFLSTFYFQYGHRSIADLAHLSFSIEKLSMLAAIIVVDEQRWDGQERSSRYQNFRKSGFYMPEFSTERLADDYRALIEKLFLLYERISTEALEKLASATPRPNDMSEEQYRRTLKARAFDIARYLLPLATMTSVGQIVNARTLAQQISRLASSQYEEVVGIADGLRTSASKPPYDLRSSKLNALLETYADQIPETVMHALREQITNGPAAPTLVKYTTPKAHDEASRTAASSLYKELLGDVSVETVATVELVEPPSLEIEVLATCLYEVGKHSYKQIIEVVKSLPADRRIEMLAQVSHGRLAHDEVRRTFASGYRFQFDILMDVGGFRDMHRHRRCIQIVQELTPLHGYAIPDQVKSMGEEQSFIELFNEITTFWNQLQTDNPNERANADYLLPLACKRRSLFKMDLAEAAYICELRTGPAGHFSYRQVAFEMFEKLQAVEPGLAAYVRVTKPSDADDLLKR